MKKGFTLIELLVIVLIIGILSAVALPEYTKAVEKSRAAEAWQVLSSARSAVSAYCLENPSEVIPTPGNDSGNNLAVKVPYTTKYFWYDFKPSSCSACTCENWNRASSRESSVRLSACRDASSSWNYILSVNAAGERTCVGSSCPKLGFTKAGAIGYGCGGNSGYYM